MSSPITPQCQFALERWRNMAKWRNLWTILLFVFGAVVVAFLCASILLFIRQTWVVGAATTLGTFASGTAMKWVVSRRKEAVQEDNEAYEDVEKQCAVTPAVGVRVLGASAPVLPPDVQNQIDELKRRQKILFGSIR